MSGIDWNDDFAGAGADSAAASPTEPAPPDPNAGAQPAEMAPESAVPDAGPPEDSPSSDTLQFGTDHGAVTPADRRRKRLLITAAAGIVGGAAAVAIALVATGGAADLTANQTPAQAVAAAARNSASVGSLTATFSERIGGPEGGIITATVAEVHKPLQMSMTMTETLAGQTIPLSGILTTNTIYIRFGHLAGLPASLAGKWLKLSVTNLPGSLGPVFQGLENENPMAQTQVLRAAKGLRADGKQTIDGVQTTKYTGYFNPAQTIQLLPASERSALGPALQEIQGNVQFSIWIDGNDQVRRLVENDTIASEPVTIDITFTSLNQPVNIVIPRGKDVVPFPASALGGG